MNKDEEIRKEFNGEAVSKTYDGFYYNLEKEGITFNKNVYDNKWRKYENLEYYNFLKENNNLLKKKIPTSKLIGQFQYGIYKQIEEEKQIDLEEETIKYKEIHHLFNISKLICIFENKDLLKRFIEIRDEKLKEYNAGDLEIYNIYFAINTHEEKSIFIKIGCSKNHPQKRINESKAFSMNKWDLWAYQSKQNKWKEKELHEKFKHLKAPEYGREIFYMDQQIIDYVNENCDYIII